MLWFTLQQQSTNPIVRIDTDYYRLCYSLHSSYNEICTFIKQISPIRIHPIALPTQITPERFNELLQQLGIKQSQTTCFAPSNKTLQIKRRYQTMENTHDNDDDNELDFGCNENRENIEKQLVKRINSLQQLPFKKCK